MAQSVCLVVSAGDRARLEAIVADRNRSRKHVARARLVLLSADRLDIATVARRAGISRPAVWRGQQRYAEAGVDGLLRDKTRKPGKAPLGDDLARRVVALWTASRGVEGWDQNITRPHAWRPLPCRPVPRPGCGNPRPSANAAGCRT